MNNLFNLLLILMCGITALEAITAESSEVFILAGTGLILSSIIFLINAYYPLFKQQH